MPRSRAMVEENTALAALLTIYRRRWEDEHGRELSLSEIATELNARLSAPYRVTFHKSQAKAHLEEGRYYALELPVLQAYSDMLNIPYALILHAAGVVDPDRVSPEALARALEETARGRGRTGDDPAKLGRPWRPKAPVAVPDEPVHARERAAQRAEKYAEAKRADKADKPTTDKDHEITILCPSLEEATLDALGRAA